MRPGRAEYSAFPNTRENTSVWQPDRTNISGMKVAVTLTIVWLLVSACALGASIRSHGDKQAEGEELIRRAKKASDIKSAGSVPFRLRMRVDTESGEGTFTETWAGPDRWHDEYAFGGVREIVVGGRSKYWILRNTDYELPSVSTVRQLLGSNFKGMAESSKLKKIRQVKKNGLSLTCVDLDYGRSMAEETLCFDNSDNLQVSKEIHQLYLIEYSDFMPFAGKLVPRTIRQFLRGQLRAEGHIEELAEVPAPEMSLFVAPTGAEEWETCDNLQPPRALNTPDPDFPAKVSTTYDQTVLYLVIEADGTFQAVPISSSGGPVFSQAALQGVKRWRFRPAMCGSRPIRSYINVIINFRKVPG